MLELVDPQLEEALAMLVKARARARETTREADDMNKELKEGVVELGMELDAKQFRVGSIVVTLSPHMSLSKDKLLASGVNPEVIAGCYNESVTMGLKKVE